MLLSQEGIHDFLVCNGLLLVLVVLSNKDVGVARGIVSQEVRSGAGFKTGDFFVKEKLGEGGGGIVERLRR